MRFKKYNAICTISRDRRKLMNKWLLLLFLFTGQLKWDPICKKYFVIWNNLAFWAGNTFSCLYKTTFTFLNILVVRLALLSQSVGLGTLTQTVVQGEGIGIKQDFAMGQGPQGPLRTPMRKEEERSKNRIDETIQVFIFYDGLALTLEWIKQFHQFKELRSLTLVMNRKGAPLYTFVYMFFSTSTYSKIDVQCPARVWISSIIINIIPYSIPII